MAAAAETAPEPPARIGGAGVLAAGAMGAAVALALGLYGRVHDPQTDLAITLGFADTITMKVWLSSVAMLFALFQVFSALWMYGRLPIASRPSWLANAHRISGRLAFLISLPVAYHCLYQLAFQDHDDARAGPLAARLPLLRRVRHQGDPHPHAGARGRAGCP